MKLKNSSQVLVVATSPQTEGGITAVVKLHQQCSFWKNFGCRWITSHYRKGIFGHLYDLLCAIATYLRYLPSCKIVHLHHSEYVSTLRKSIFFIIAKLFCKKTILHFHAFSPDSTVRGRFSALYRYLFTHADCVIVLSAFWKRALLKEYGELSNIEVVYNPCSPPQKQDLPKKKQILYAGTLNQRKGYSVLLKAFASISSKFPDWRLVFAGNGEIELARAIARDLKIEGQCDFLGWISGEAKHTVFSQSSVFCLPSFAEGFPMAVLDAWSYRLPVITTPVGGIPDFAVDGSNCMLFEPGNVNVLERHLKSLLSSAVMREHIACSGNEFAQEMFSLSKVNSDLESIYMNLLL